MTIASLRKSGVKVRVNHLRIDRNDIIKLRDRAGFINLDGQSVERNRVLAKLVKPLSQIQSKDIFCKGGITRVTIENEDGTIGSFAESVCSINDSYNRKLGIKIALGRALAK